MMVVKSYVLIYRENGMFTDVPLLSLIIWVPIIGGIICMFAGDDRKATRARCIALLTAFINLLLCVPLYLGFDKSTSNMQFVENIDWIAKFGVHYQLGVDGISVLMVILSTITTFLVVIASWRPIKKNVAQYMAAFLIMQGMMVGVFESLDAILFYVFWEGMLIPMYLCIGMWGGARRTYASIKFFLYTFLGSALMLIAILYLRTKTTDFNILSFYSVQLTMTEQVYIFIAFLLAFAVKIPMWPVHTWLPDAHTEAPAGGSVVLAALMLKMGIYGILRFSMPITPDASQHLAGLMIVLSLIAIVYIAVVAVGQTDMKRLIAYSSVAHMGFTTLACFVIYKIVAKTGDLHNAYLTLEGGMVQMLSHAFSTGAMFLGVGVLYERLHSREINAFGGVAHKMPLFAALFMLFALANVGLPGTSGFVGEFLIILGSFKASYVITLFAATTLVLSATYTLWMYKRVFFGKVMTQGVEDMHDLEMPEYTVLFILAFLVIFIGVYPNALLSVFHTSIGHLLELSTTSKL
jgi:NADH-quinone oxidoreductase subunit M